MTVNSLELGARWKRKGLQASLANSALMYVLRMPTFPCQRYFFPLFLASTTPLVKLTCFSRPTTTCITIASSVCEHKNQITERKSERRWSWRRRRRRRRRKLCEIGGNAVRVSRAYHSTLVPAQQLWQQQHMTSTTSLSSATTNHQQSSTAIGTPAEQHGDSSRKTGSTTLPTPASEPSNQPGSSFHNSSPPWNKLNFFFSGWGLYSTPLGGGRAAPRQTRFRVELHQYLLHTSGGWLQHQDLMQKNK